MRTLPLLTVLAACAPEAPPATPSPAPDATAAAAEATPADPAARVDHQAELRPAPDAPVTFQPPARGAYPEGPFGDAVRRGEALFRDTPSTAPDYVGNGLSCSNCHLDDGRRADSGPMWAAWGMYPAYRKKNDKVNSVEERLQGCFTYSLDAPHSRKGKAPPAGEPLLTDLQAYMYWLATDAPTGRALPGRAYPKVDKPAKVDAEHGAEVYAASCAVCHGADGGGQQVDGRTVFPPLWGPGSYNWGAGMHRINTAAGFIQANMPLGQPATLSDQDAWDVAAYINSQPRPRDPRQTGTIAAADQTYHSEDCSYGETDHGTTLGAGAK